MSESDIWSFLAAFLTTANCQDWTRLTGEAPQGWQKLKSYLYNQYQRRADSVLNVFIALNKLKVDLNISIPHTSHLM